MAELKTKKNRASVTEFLRQIADPQQRKDCRALAAMMRQVTGCRPQMWGDSIVGFGSYHYKYASGREGDWFLTGFSPRKGNLSVYILAGLARHKALLKKLGKHKTGKSCLYIKSLDAIDTDVLRQLIEVSVAEVRAGQQGC